MSVTDTKHVVVERSRAWFQSLGGGKKRRWLLLLFIALFLVSVVLGILWNQEPELFDVNQSAKEVAASRGEKLVTGYVTTATLMEVADTMLHKPGGFLSNDIAPPGVWMDNIPSWEFGVLVQIRDLSQALRADLSRAQSQSQEDPNLAKAEPQFNFDNKSWIVPASESEYKAGLKHLDAYLKRLAGVKGQDNKNAGSLVKRAQFFARADNLTHWLSRVESRLGSLSQRLSASVGRDQLDTGLAGESSGSQANQAPIIEQVKTPWMQIDNVFYEARGTSWALVLFLKAIAVDFQSVLEKKNALVSLKQIISELEAAQSTVWSPVILNGTGFGLFANHSLVMASYIARANAALIDLRLLLENG